MRFVGFESNPAEHGGVVDSGVVPRVLRRLFASIAGEGDAIEQFRRMQGTGAEGRLNHADMATALARMGLDISHQHVEEVVHFLDGDGDGEISVEDMVDRAYLGNLEWLQSAFRRAAERGRGSFGTL